MNLQGQVAVVTGASGGLGSPIAKALAAHGASVACQDIADGVEATAEAIGAAGGPQAAAYVCDVSDSAAVDAMFADVDRRWGRVDVLVNNAGVGRTPGDGRDEADDAPLITRMTDSGWQRIIDVNLNGAFYCARAAVRRMAPAGRGSVINMSSISGLTGIGVIHYSTTKAGLLGFTRQLAADLGPFGIRVNAVCPGVIDTPMIEGVDVERLRAMTPLGRIGVPDDVTGAVLYLASDDSSFTTGQWLSPNGGIFMG
ncbi:MAG: SDR family NAD(P)-dependent oxidoreductase [Solirubrobacteraceae bacterium]|nr:SDR family NAD(P)-dependent oxidoreductase [Solirubrobacteraceae bacterium]